MKYKHKNTCIILDADVHHSLCHRILSLEIQTRKIRDEVRRNINEKEKKYVSNHTPLPFENCKLNFA